MLACCQSQALKSFWLPITESVTVLVWMALIKPYPCERWQSLSLSVTQSCLTLFDPMDCSPPDSSVHGIFQARILEWVAILLQGIFPWVFWVSCIGRQVLYHWFHLGNPEMRVGCSKEKSHGRAFRLLRKRDKGERNIGGNQQMSAMTMFGNNPKIGIWGCVSMKILDLGLLLHNCTHLTC